MNTQKTGTPRARTSRNQTSRTAQTFLLATVLPLAALLTPASPAHAQAESASSTINRLRAQGYDVQVSRIGNGPLDQCTVAGVRELPGAQLPFTLNDDDDFNVFTVVPKQKVAVSLNCSA